MVILKNVVFTNLHYRISNPINIVFLTKYPYYGGAFILENIHKIKNLKKNNQLEDISAV